MILYSPAECFEKTLQLAPVGVDLLFEISKVREEQEASSRGKKRKANKQGEEESSTLTDTFKSSP